MTKVLMKYYPSDDNSKYILENRKDSKGVHTHSFTTLPSLRNYLRNELKIARAELNEIVDLLIESGIVYTNNPLLKTYLQKGSNTKNTPTINIVKPKSIDKIPDHKPNYFGGVSEVNSNHLSKHLHLDWLKMEGGKNNNSSSINLTKGRDNEEMEELFNKKIEEMEERYVKKIEEMEKKTEEKWKKMEERCKKNEERSKKNEEVYVKYINQQLEQDYKQNDRLLEFLPFIEDASLLWFLIILPYRRFKNEKIEEKFYKKCCNRFEELI